MKNLKLTLDLIPSSSWRANVRSAVSKQQWDLIRGQVTSQAWDSCEICGVSPHNRSPDCHEVFSYDEINLIQKLEKMISLCQDCHMCKHFGFARVQGKEIQALHHFMKINNISKEEAELYIQQEFDLWKERSKKNWTLDLSYLKIYGIVIK